MTPDMFGAAPSYRRPQEPIVRRALVEGIYRFWLYRGWASGPCAFWGMLNPSTADVAQDDPTLWQVMKTSARLGFGSAYVGNVYPIRSANPSDMHVWRGSFEAAARRGEDRLAIWRRNANEVAKLCSQCDAHFAAWGNELRIASDLFDWLKLIDQECGRPIAWQCFGTTASGAPKHPLARGRHRIPDGMIPTPWARPA